MSQGSWDEMQQEIERQVDVRLAELRAEGKTLYEQVIDEDDTSPAKPELWCLVLADTGEDARRRLSEGDVEAFLAEHPDWVDIWTIDDMVRDRVSESWDVTGEDAPGAAPSAP